MGFGDGFVVGFVLVVVELVGYVVISAFIPVYQIMHISTFVISLSLIGLLIIDLLRNGAIGIQHDSTAVGHIAGTGFGLAILWCSIIAMNEGALVDVLAGLIVLTVSFVIGLGITFGGYNDNHNDIGFPM